jgi:hypothetical protein
VVTPRQRLLQLLPWARAEAKKKAWSIEVSSALAKATMQYVTEDNLEGIAIYPAPKGGWHCDVTLINVPPGVPNALGTQVAHPLATRADAEAHAKILLVTIL